ncbi:MAG TPA: hypothetical protein VF456_06450 [Vicinamibacterales bacterium]
MANRITLRLYGALTAAVLLVASPAAAQFTPKSLNDPATGEQFHIEGAAGFWMPSANMSIASEALGIIGSTIDFKNDLGLTDRRLSELQVVGRPARRHKLRFAYIPIDYVQDNGFKIPRDIIFNGQKYASGIPTNSELLWKAYRFAYEYDFITRNRGFGGFILEAKYTDVTASLETPVVNQFIHAKAPIPAIGGIARYYVVPNISITGEVTGVKIPDSISKQYKAHYADVDIYGTLNFTNNIGVQGGFRSIDVGYHVDSDTGSFVLKGIYFGVVARY